ncbi:MULTISPECIES: N-acetylmuramic acid 6-phosphate etherase [Bacillus]|jgi:N-acetylmuramic acid 6-phosphate etherase|uniref:N-acetylmuramic acid 6-phosphate etherase n=1 Tax=Bacillus smithii 7_3_47FAA TaxID=665952 RepID=G9QPG5_9BACI|nr:N-acetylmuramic acid 6-phosphate etherase [Bacillus smithii]EHL73827.1 N-acetylmuramic acid 6-phosphate etherase [Bacillus smithii 7_3_47FAA]MED0658596.1 N-acetylmuramic acid 6-phosphate etherase [Bacillus smithii]MED1418939.1 N-acetylmuramic acid 6-phosphate etherase [Bacillus smithii]MED1455195.1 N-acetylmuramic acid 6-phosphate etherase [Bacillus smithii]
MLEKLTTEQRNASTMDLDLMSTREILEVMNREDQTVPQAVATQIPLIEKAVQLVIRSFQNGGRLIYVGAGTSGRLGVLDAVECMPTFSAPKNMVTGILAGGLEALTKAVEGAEDNESLGKDDLKSIFLNENDTVIGLAASGRTPYVKGALSYAKEQKANTVSISCNKQAEISQLADVAIEVETGPEVLTGSTRLKAGTAQKLVLNMISTASMIGIGKTYQNLMVDVQPTNQKLVERSKRIIMEATDVDYETASQYFEKANHHVKAAIIMILLKCSYEEAIKKLEKAKGFIRKAL